MLKEFVWYPLYFLVGISNISYYFFTIGATLSFWYGYYRLFFVVIVFFIANSIYVYVNFDRIAADQMKTSMIDENYRYIVDG